ncbi:hypothetical protein CXT76_02500 [Candidatus Parvarchaeota archaeon]|jgi:hypothetical protein|nr:MAG: hypothetical protein CXT76_02500 [Candidatus Parvarchaeota archaeon]HIG51842.1 hypothetical protein [Candidatus Pacearchaeota archaeon]
MKIQPYVEKLEASEKYKEFKEKYKDSFLVAGFFIIDLETKQNIHQIDYYLPSENKVAAFTLDGEVNLQILNTMGKKVPETLDLKTNVDLDALQGILEDGMKNRNMTEKIKKMIAVIQTMEGKKVWVMNCVLSGLEILKANIDDETQNILKMEKSSILDYVKTMPGRDPSQMQKGEPTKEDLDKEIEQLDKLKEALTKEKETLKK